MACALAAAGALAAPARAGGLLLYEVGTADVGLASAGYTARAQDASTVFTNPAGMTRLDGTRSTLAAQVLYGDLEFAIGQGPRPDSGTANGGNPVGWFPGGGVFVFLQRVAGLQARLRRDRQLRPRRDVRDPLGGRYYVAGGDARRPVDGAVRRVPRQPAMVGGCEPECDVRQVRARRSPSTTSSATDGQLVLHDYQWGFGANLGVLFEPSPRTRFGLI